MLLGKSLDGYNIILVEFEKTDVPIYRIFYYLVVSRRDYMNETVCDIRSQTMYDMQNVKIVTFDRFKDNIRKLKSYHSW